MNSELKYKLSILKSTEIKILYLKCLGYQYRQIALECGWTGISNVQKRMTKIYQHFDIDTKILNKYELEVEIKKPGGVCETLNRMMDELLQIHHDIEKVFDEWPPEIEEPELVVEYLPLVLEEIRWEDENEEANQPDAEYIHVPPVNAIQPQTHQVMGPDQPISRWRRSAAIAVMVIIGIMVLGLMLLSYMLGQNRGVRIAPITVIPPTVVVEAEVPDVTVIPPNVELGVTQIVVQPSPTPLPTSTSTPRLLAHYEPLVLDYHVGAFNDDFEVDWSVTDGNFTKRNSGGGSGNENDGYLEIHNFTDGKTTYVFAPRQILINLLPFNEIRFELKQITQGPPGGEIKPCGEMPGCVADIIVESRGEYAYYNFESIPRFNNWTTMAIPINEDKWRVNGDVSFSYIFEYPTSFQIRSEYLYHSPDSKPAISDSIGFDSFRYVKIIQPFGTGRMPETFWERVKYLLFNK